VAELKLKTEPIEPELHNKLKELYMIVTPAFSLNDILPLRRPIFFQLSLAKKKLEEMGI